MPLMSEQDQMELQADYATLRRAFFMAVSAVVMNGKHQEEIITPEQLNKVGFEFLARSEEIDLCRFFSQHNRLPTPAEEHKFESLTGACARARAAAKKQFEDLDALIAAEQQKQLDITKEAEIASTPV